MTNLDYSAILLAILALCGLILLVQRFLPGRADNAVVSVARSAFPVLLIVLLFRSFLFEPFRIPSASMMPLLQEGDFILVNKFNYGLRLPVLNTKILAIGAPRRGDVIVFHSTSGPPINLIKRLVGLPGDHIIVRDNHLFINGTAVTLAPDGEYSGGFGFTGAPLEKESFGPSEHVIMLAQNRYAADFDGIVPPDHYFFMGDNRVLLDTRLIETMIRRADEITEKLNARCAKVTKGAVTSPGTQAARLAKWLTDKGLPVDSLSKGHVNDALQRVEELARSPEAEAQKRKAVIRAFLAARTPGGTGALLAAKRARPYADLQEALKLRQLAAK